jgi:predicted HNH restriction endonuclease
VKLTRNKITNTQEIKYHMTKIKIITPDVETENPFNIMLTRVNNEVKLSIVKHPNNGAYAIINKDGSVPDIEIDDATLDTLIAARRLKRKMDKMMTFVRENPEQAAWLENIDPKTLIQFLDIFDKTT